MTAGGREFQVAGSAVCTAEGSFADISSSVWTAHRETEQPTTAWPIECRRVPPCHVFRFYRTMLLRARLCNSMSSVCLCLSVKL